jgi:hypothetical protein
MNSLCSGKLNMAPSVACPGEFRNRLTMPAISTSPINTPALACPAGAQARTQRGCCHRALRHRACGHDRSRKPPCKTFAAWMEAGGSGAYGFYEALDYTSTRVPEGEKVAVVRAYLAHHQGMSLRRHRQRIERRRDAQPLSRRAHGAGHELLLQERTPRDVLVARPRAEEVSVTRPGSRVLTPPACGDLTLRIVPSRARICFPTGDTL